jgi:hypothetical protein
MTKITEAFNSAIPLTPYRDGDLQGYTFHSDGREFFVGFADDGDDEYYMSFTGQDDRGRQSAKLMGANKPFPVFAAVAKAVLLFIAETAPDQISFEVDGAESKRARTYDRMLDMFEKRNLLPDGYVWDRDGNDRYYIFVDGHR